MNVARSWRVPLALASSLALGLGVAVATLRPSQSPGVTGGSPSSVVHAALQSTLRQNPSFPGVAVVVRSPGVRWTDAVGLADRQHATPLTPATPFRIASVTKTFTAAAILRLVDDGRLSLNDPIVRLISRRSRDLLRSGGYDPMRITVRMLLQHTSGIFDFASDQSYRATVTARPNHRWSRHEQLAFAMDVGRPLAEPGRQFHYSDTGYLLLGEILERTSGMTTARAYRELLHLDALGLRHTYLESLEPARGTELTRAHQYLDDQDAYGFDPSFDLYGAGGLVSTLDDLVTFARALHGGRIVSKTALGVMHGPAEPTRVDELGLGLFAVRLGTETCYGHQGFWGTNVTHCPSSGITIASTVNQAAEFEPASLALHQTLYALAVQAASAPSADGA